MKKTYEEATMEVISFEAADVITTSGTCPLQGDEV